MRLATKIFLSAALAIAVLAAVAGWSIVAVNRLAEQGRQITSGPVPALQIVHSLPDAMGRAERLEGRYLVLHDARYFDQWARHEKSMEAALGRLAGLLTSEEERQALDQVRAALTDYRRAVEAVHGLITFGKAAQAQRVAETRSRPAADQVRTSLDELARATAGALTRWQASTDALVVRTRNTVLAALLTAVGGALAVSWYLSRRMTRSLRRLSAATEELTRGTLSGPVPVEGSDEIAALARTFNHAAAQLRRIDQMREDFFAQVTHDLRNPLGAIRGAIQLLVAGLGPALGERHARLLGTADRSSRRMLSMVNQIMDFCRLRAQAFTLDRQPVELGKVVSIVMDELQPWAEQQGLTFATEVAAGGVFAVGDEASLVRVVDNLVGNALKFTPRGGQVTVRVLARAGETEVSVEDTGPGIPPEAVDRIFDPYQQAHGTRRGFGIGLAVVRGVVEAHGGRVRVESRPGAGSTFAITLPAVTAP